MKRAVVYDKWLHTLGGGEVVACHIAKILKEIGYDVIFICGKKISLKVIREKTNVDLSGIKFIDIWNDEIELKKIVQGKDLFINVSFMDYSYGYAKKNIYYTHFPTQVYNNLKGFVFTNIIIPNLGKYFKPLEFINQFPPQEYKEGHLMYLIEKKVRLGFSYLNPKKIYLLKFTIFFENFYKSLIEEFNFKVENVEVKSKKITVDHNYNIIVFNIYLNPKSETIFLDLINKNKNEKIYLINPKIITIKIPDFIYKLIYEKINARLRAGLFINIKERLKSYQKIICHSEFVKKWIKNYWQRDAHVLYPSVDLLFDKYDLSKIKKKNWICSVGRFFTLGHGKKQEILVQAFKKLYHQGLNDWQLHLVGGIGNEPSSIEFLQYLKKQAKGYPIYFHLNVSKKKVEEILLKSKIYWQATGYKENENKTPIKFEHFGIAPIEAISAGCIPILYNGGGMKEVIEKIFPDKDNYLFSLLNELINKTKNAINKNKNSDYFKVNNQKLNVFSIKKFKERFVNLLDNNTQLHN